MAMTIYDGWDELEIVKSTGTNPDSENSIVIYAKTAREKKYGYQPYVLISQVITKESLEDFTDDEIFPIEKVHYTDTNSTRRFHGKCVIERRHKNAFLYRKIRRNTAAFCWL